MRRLMVVTSGGGHWVQMRRLLPALDFPDADRVFVSTMEHCDQDLEGRYYQVRDVTRRDRLGLVVVVMQLVRIMRRERPHVVITTGAAPGVLALALAKWLVGSRTVWIDSISSSENMTMSGKMAKHVADLWLVQWPNLARPEGPHYWGAVL